MSTALALVDNNHFSTYSDAENLARKICARMESIAAKLRTLEDDIRKLWLEFDKLRPGQTILGCATKKEFCERKLHRTPRAIQYLLSRSDQRSRVIEVMGGCCESCGDVHQGTDLHLHHRNGDGENHRRELGDASIWDWIELVGFAVAKRRLSLLCPRCYRKAEVQESEQISLKTDLNTVLGKLFMKVDRLLPQSDSYFSQDCDSDERQFPQMVEDAIANVQPTFTIAYKTFANVKAHRNLRNGYITKNYKIADLAGVLEKAAAYLTASAERIKGI